MLFQYGESGKPTDCDLADAQIDILDGNEGHGSGGNLGGARRAVFRRAEM